MINQILDWLGVSSKVMFGSGNVESYIAVSLQTRLWLPPADFLRKILDSCWVDRVEEDQQVLQAASTLILFLISFCFVTFFGKYEYNKDCCCCC